MEDRGRHTLMIDKYTHTIQLTLGEDHEALKAAARADVLKWLAEYIAPGITYVFKLIEETRGPEMYEVATSAGTFIARIEVYTLMDACL